MQAKVIWLTGLSGAGKTTLACHLVQRLTHLRVLNSFLDGDVLRQTISADLGYDQLSRSEHVLRVARLADEQCKAGCMVIVALISPLLKDRLLARSIVGNSYFLEVYLSTPLYVCQKRDPKGLYAKHAQGIINHMAGLDICYEPPISPEIVLDTQLYSIDATADLLWSQLKKVL